MTVAPALTYSLTVQSADVIDAYEADDGIELTALVSSDQLMAVRVDIAPGATLRIHEHPHEQAGYVAQGSFTFIGDDTREVSQDDGLGAAGPRTRR